MSVKKGWFAIVAIVLVLVLAVVVSNSLNKSGVSGNAIALLPSTSNGLVAYYDFDGNTNDVLGLYNGTMSGASCNSAGKIGTSCLFAGSANSWINVTSIPRLVNSFSYSFWVKASQLQGIDAVSATGVAGTTTPYNQNPKRYLFYPNTTAGTNASVAVSVGTNGVSVYEHATSYMPARAVYNNASFGSDWNHVVIVYNNRVANIYVNGIKVANSTTSPKAGVYSSIKLGGGSYGYFAGSIDELRIYNKALNASEIFDLYESRNYTDCFARCGVKGNGVNVPQISSINSSCYFKEGCGSATILSNANSGDFSYDYIWLYKYKDGSSKTVCACDGTGSVAGMSTRSNSVSGALNLPLNITDDGSKIVSNVTFYVLASKESNRSGTSSSVINVNYRCQNGCYVLGQNVSVSNVDQSETNKYRTCVNLPAPNQTCMNFSEVRTCDAGLKFVGGMCQYSGTFNCNEEGDFCGESGVSIIHASLESSKSCALAGVGCYKCNSGYVFDSTQKACVNSSCMTQVGGMNSCSRAGGICKNATVSGSTLNASLDCCSSNSCYVCQAGYHVSNEACVANDCSGSKPHGNNFTLGANNTNLSSANMVWNYVVGPVGACQWNCSSDYRLNISDNSSCVYGRLMCSDASVNGICTNVSLGGGINYSASADCASGSCFVCDNSLRYFSNGTGCVLNNSCSSGMAWNGLTCVSPISGCTGCVLGTKCIGSSDTTKIMRVNVNVSGSITKAYCDPNSKMFVSLVADNQTCSYNAQCASNLCGADLRCLNIAKEVRDASGFMKKVYCWFSTGFSFNSTAYNTCLAAP